MRRLTALVACLAVVAVPLAGCGSKDPGVPKRDASELIRLLRKVRTASDDPQRCTELAADVARVSAKVGSLPSKVDADVRSSLENGVKNLADAARTQCQNTQTTTTATTPTATTPTQTIPPPSTAITPPPSTATAPPPSTATTPPSTVPPATTPGTGGTGPGNGNGNGNAIGPQGQGGGGGKIVAPGAHGHGHKKDKHKGKSGGKHK